MAQNNKIQKQQQQNNRQPFHEKIKMSHADSGTKHTDVMIILFSMQNLYRSKIQVAKTVIYNFS